MDFALELVERALAFESTESSRAKNGAQAGLPKFVRVRECGRTERAGDNQQNGAKATRLAWINRPDVF